MCSFAVGWKFTAGYDDSLDVVGVHFTGGIAAQDTASDDELQVLHIQVRLCSSPCAYHAP